MPVVLDDVFVPACLQALGGLKEVIIKAREHCAVYGLTQSDVFEARLSDDVETLPHQVQMIWAHTAHVLEQVQHGEFRATVDHMPSSWSDMVILLQNAEIQLLKLDCGDLEHIANDPVYVYIGDGCRFKFIVKNFLLSFSLPNVYFHVANIHYILRHVGVDIGEFEYLGKLQTEPMDKN